MKSTFCLACFTLLNISLFATPNGIEHHEDISLSLFAKEPMIVDPVAMTFTANGDAFVVEMRDYPYGIDGKGKPGGTIKLLRDKNNDGIADESHTFAENLSFPTSVMAWRSGIVTALPQILFSKIPTTISKPMLKK